MRKLTYYVGVTLDGFIAAPDGSHDFFPVGPDLLQWIVAEYADTLPTHLREKLGADGPTTRFDTVVMGRATYQPALAAGITSPYAHLRQYVVSRSLRESPDPAVQLIAGDPVAKVRALKQEPGKGIYLAGGGKLAGELLAEIDELVMKLYPIAAGAGIPAFTSSFSPTAFALRSSRPLESGVVVLTYDRT